MMLQRILNLFRYDLARNSTQAETLLQQTAFGVGLLYPIGYLLDCVVEQVLHACTNRASDQPANPDSLLSEFDLPPDPRFLADKFNWVRKRATVQGLFDAMHLIGYDDVQIYNQSGFILSPYSKYVPIDFTVYALTRYAQNQAHPAALPIPWFTVVVWGMPILGQIQVIDDAPIGSLDVGFVPDGTPNWSKPADDRALIESICRWSTAVTEACAEIVYCTNTTVAPGTFFLDGYLHADGAISYGSTDSFDIRDVEAGTKVGFAAWV